jgi:hypothetical protein
VLNFNMLKSDRIRLQHLIEAAREAISFLTGKSKADLFSDIRENPERGSA